MLSKAQKQKALCAFLLVVGLGICIGAIWMPVLLAAGIPIVSAGLGVAADMYDPKDKYTINYYVNEAAANVASNLSPNSKEANDRKLALKVIARLKAIAPTGMKQDAIAAVINKPSIIITKDAPPEVKEAMREGMTLLFSDESSRQIDVIEKITEESKKLGKEAVKETEEEEEECKRVSPKANTLSLD